MIRPGYIFAQRAKLGYFVSVSQPTTPVRITRRHPSIRTGRLEAWEAVSVDGDYTYVRIEDTGTPWAVEHVPTRTDCGLWPSLPKARRATAGGSALAAARADTAT